MAETSAISWTKSTFNPWIGCTKVGPGCDHCYAEALDKRHKWKGMTHWGAGVERMKTSPSTWKNPLAWNAKAMAGEWPWRVFCASLADVFDNEVPQAWRDDLWALIEATPYLTWQIVTKRIGNVRKMIPDRWQTAMPGSIWLIATMVNQEEFDRDWPKLRDSPADIRGLSIEPMLGRIWFPNDVRDNLDWAIYGGESLQLGKGRECNIEWIYDGIKQCRAHGIAPFVKQLGTYSVAAGEVVMGTGKKADMDEWPEGLRVREFPCE